MNTTLLCLENTHNFAGGAVMNPTEWTTLVDAARSRDLKVHLDGARLWNAAAALDVSPTELTSGADTVQVCLSKGLGAPVGSILAASPELITEARRIRKMLGGGVRQGGVLAAAGIVALRSQARLSDDHDNAQRLASGLRERGWAVDEPATNIVLAATADPSATVAQLAAVDVGAVTVAGKVRFVTHRDVSTADIDAVLSRIVS
ncbi:hypothetical protein GCM10020255_034160 [Rhodococcus baikonurensis]